VTESTQPLSINHSGEVPSVTVSFDLAQGLCAQRRGLRVIAPATISPSPTIQGSFQGTAAAFQQSTQNMGMLLLIAMIVVYIILGILYESFIHPLTILSGLPSAAVGALLTCIWWAAADALCLCRHDHADRHRQEERHHDDRLRAAAKSASMAPRRSRRSWKPPRCASVPS
jgi:hypothetical protein